MTSDARRAELSAKWDRWRLKAGGGGILDFLVEVDSDAESRGIAKGLEMAARNMALDVTLSRHKAEAAAARIRALSKNTKGQGR